MPQRISFIRNFFFVILFFFFLSPGFVHAAVFPIHEQVGDVDTDSDGVPDRVELLLGSDLTKADSDGDGYSDSVEIQHRYSPTSTAPIQLTPSFLVHRKTQLMDVLLGGVVIDSTQISSGRPGSPTPLGTFTITAKSPRAWSNHSKLWMPWWMNFTGKGAPAGLYALHELPEWPGGKKEGLASLGKPVSGGCIRMGVAEAKPLYAWTPLGSKVVVVD